MMSAKQITPEQARQFHMAMTGHHQCFHNCCLCEATRRITQLETEAGGLRKLAHGYIQAYEKLAFGDVALEAGREKEEKKYTLEEIKDKYFPDRDLDSLREELDEWIGIEAGGDVEK